ncbi:KRR1 small subunit processome component homolog isoform X2 [Rosa chinensis]|uniref:KRR1 small subunit processome component homolog isoform X2 n=1 Tax=Rosa chinensis TaxID=74649 RepID=UPI000D0924BE|nr:KRR1 small subunit processome component homolog isoform X2 [Rosa chinensis]
MENSNPKADQIEVEVSEFENDFDVVSYTKFYDEFLNVDLLQESWPKVESSLEEYGVLCTLDMVEGKMKVSRATRDQDPNIILRAMDVLELLSRSVPAEWAIRVLDCSFQYDIIKIGNQEEGICNMYGITKEQFLARRKLLAGYVLKGNTIAVIGGSLQGINIVRRIVEDCIAHDVPPLPRARLMKKKSQKKKDEMNKVASELMINLEGMRI